MDTESKNAAPTGLRSWSDLPSDILSVIANRLPIVELLSFRGTCKDFRSASSSASAATESSRTPWLLSHKNGSSDCLFYNEDESKTYTRNIPDLEGAICLSSYQGWLLLFKNGSVFFFCPFSLTKIPLPDFGHRQFAGHVAAFSDVPTSPNCIVSIINRIDSRFLEINVISKGQKAWTQHLIEARDCLMSAIYAATFDHKSRNFYYMDNGKTLLTFSVEDNSSNKYVFVEKKTKNSVALPYWYKNHEDALRHLHLEDDEYVDVCGLTLEPTESRQGVYLNKVVDGSAVKKRMRRAVWVQPRFFEAEPNLKW